MACLLAASAPWPQTLVTGRQGRQSKRICSGRVVSRAQCQRHSLPVKGAGASKREVSVTLWLLSSAYCSLPSARALPMAAPRATRRASKKAQESRSSIADFVPYPPIMEFTVAGMSSLWLCTRRWGHCVDVFVGHLFVVPLTSQC